MWFFLHPTRRQRLGRRDPRSTVRQQPQRPVGMSLRGRPRTQGDDVRLLLAVRALSSARSKRIVGVIDVSWCGTKRRDLLVISRPARPHRESIEVRSVYVPEPLNANSHVPCLRL